RSARRRSAGDVLQPEPDPEEPPRRDAALPGPLLRVGALRHARRREAHQPVPARREPRSVPDVHGRLSGMIKQVVFLKKRADLSMEQFMAYYENQHTQLAKRMGAKPSLPNAQRYVRRYIRPEKNPLTGEVIHPGYDCIMEIWWNTREDFEAAMKGL